MTKQESKGKEVKEGIVEEKTSKSVLKNGFSKDPKNKVVSLAAGIAVVAGVGGFAGGMAVGRVSNQNSNQVPSGQRGSSQNQQMNEMSPQGGRPTENPQQIQNNEATESGPNGDAPTPPNGEKLGGENSKPRKSPTGEGTSEGEKKTGSKSQNDSKKQKESSSNENSN